MNLKSFLIPCAFGGFLISAVAPAWAQSNLPPVTEELSALMLEIGQKSPQESAAEAYLGSLYLRGGQVIPDASAASKWLGVASENGDPVSSYILARMYFDGTGVQLDKRKALEFAKNASGTYPEFLADRLNSLFPGQDFNQQPAEVAGINQQEPVEAGSDESGDQVDPLTVRVPVPERIDVEVIKEDDLIETGIDQGDLNNPVKSMRDEEEDFPGPYILKGGVAYNAFDTRDIFDRVAYSLQSEMRGVTPAIKPTISEDGYQAFSVWFQGIPKLDLARKICASLGKESCDVRSMRNMDAVRTIDSGVEVKAKEPEVKKNSAFGFDRVQERSKPNEFGHLKVSDALEFFAQISSVFSENDAKIEVQRVRARFAEALQSLDLTVKAETYQAQDQVIYRVVTTGFKTEADVRNFCAYVASRDDQCIVRTR